MYEILTSDYFIGNLLVWFGFWLWYRPAVVAIEFQKDTPLYAAIIATLIKALWMIFSSGVIAYGTYLLTDALGYL